MEGIKSLLFVPADKKRLSKIGSIKADAYIIDLEDSIEEELKDAALQLTIDYLNECAVSNVYVRINKNRYKKELSALANYKIGFVLPKFNDPGDYSDFSELFMMHDVIALIESAKSIMNANRISAISWVDALAFGAEDFTAETGINNSCEYLGYSKNLIVLSAKAYGKKVYDTPCFHLRSDKYLECELEQALNLGFDGKLAIHPEQINKINNAFRLADPKYMRDIIQIFESSGLSVCEIDGRVYERLHINRLKKRLLQES